MAAVRLVEHTSISAGLTPATTCSLGPGETYPGAGPASWRPFRTEYIRHATSRPTRRGSRLFPWNSIGEQPMTPAIVYCMSTGYTYPTIAGRRNYECTTCTGRKCLVARLRRVNCFSPVICSRGADCCYTRTIVASQEKRGGRRRRRPYNLAEKRRASVGGVVHRSVATPLAASPPQPVRFGPSLGSECLGHGPVIENGMTRLSPGRGWRRNFT